MKVLDANVVVKWYVPEAGEELAHALLDSQEMLVAPSLIRLEVLAAIVKCVRDQRSTAEVAEARCTKWQSQLNDRIIVTVDNEELLDNAIGLGLKVRHHLYDCLYLSLCQRLDATLVTFDEELARKAKLASIKYELLREPKPN